MVKQQTLLVITLTIFLCQGALAKQWRTCISAEGVAVVKSIVNCGDVGRQSFVSAKLDTKDPNFEDVLGQATELVVRLNRPDYAGDLKSRIGDVEFSELVSRQMAAVFSIFPDFSNVLGNETYRITFILKNSVRVQLLIEAELGTHEWGRAVE